MPRIALLGGLAIPAHRLGLVLRHARAGSEHQAEIELCGAVAQVGRSPPVCTFGRKTGRKHSLDANLMVREAGSIRQMKVNVLADTGAELHRCALTKNWVDF